jgi:hypothetical protein
VLRRHELRRLEGGTLVLPWRLPSIGRLAQSFRELSRQPPVSRPGRQRTRLTDAVEVARLLFRHWRIKDFPGQLSRRKTQLSIYVEEKP